MVHHSQYVDFIETHLALRCRELQHVDLLDDDEGVVIPPPVEDGGAEGSC